MYFGFSTGFSPKCNQGHIGGNINISPLLQLACLFILGKLVLPPSLSSKYTKNVKNSKSKKQCLLSFDNDSTESIIKFILNCSSQSIFGLRIF